MRIKRRTVERKRGMNEERGGIESEEESGMMQFLSLFHYPEKRRCTISGLQSLNGFGTQFSVYFRTSSLSLKTQRKPRPNLELLMWPFTFRSQG